MKVEFTILRPSSSVFRPSSYLLVSALIIFLCNCASAPPSNVVRLGYFPNITHAQAVIGIGDGTFQRALGDSAKIDAKVFNAGPSAIEALFAGQLDLTYI